MGKGKNFTPDEVTYIEEKWGSMSIANIAKKIGRSYDSIKNKSSEMGLTDPRFMGDGITINQLSKALNMDYRRLLHWIEKYGMPAKGKIFAKESKVLFIRYTAFWDWAEENKHVVNFAKMEKGAIGAEPNWVKDKRKIDIQSTNKSTNNDIDWSLMDDKKLLSLVNMQRYNYIDLVNIFNRSATAIKRRLYELGSKARPIRINNHVKYTREETLLLIEMAEQGYGFHLIAEKLGKSELGVRGKLERMKFDFRSKKVPNSVFMEVNYGQAK